MLFLPKPGASPAGRHAAAEGYRQHTRPTRHEGARFLARHKRGRASAGAAHVRHMGCACYRWTACATRPVPHADSAARILGMPSPAKPALQRLAIASLLFQLESLCRKKLEHAAGKAAGRGGNERNVSMLRGRARQHLEMGALTLIGCASAFALYGMFLLVRQASP